MLYSQRLTRLVYFHCVDFSYVNRNPSFFYGGRTIIFEIYFTYFTLTIRQRMRCSSKAVSNFLWVLKLAYAAVRNFYY